MLLATALVSSSLAAQAPDPAGSVSGRLSSAPKNGGSGIHWPAAHKRFCRSEKIRDR